MKCYLKTVKLNPYHNNDVVLHDEISEALPDFEFYILNQDNCYFTVKFIVLSDSDSHIEKCEKKLIAYLATCKDFILK